MRNCEIRQTAKSHGIFLYQLAKILGISESTLMRKLREDLTKEEKEEYLRVIRNLSSEIKR